MISIFDIERAAQRLERCLAMGLSPEVQILLGLEFFGLLRDASCPCGPDSYLTQFMPRLGNAAALADPEEFFPDEADELASFAEWVGRVGGEAHKAAMTAVLQVATASQNFLSECLHSVAADEAHESPARGAADGAAAVALNCLFVEHFPDLDLPPRGRLLKLTVTATRIPAKTGSDDIVVRNPVTKPDDRFLAQARDSVRAAREYMHRRYGLQLSKRYRLDFAVDSTGARFTGDSLGVAFAIGAIAAVARIEVLRERVTVLPGAAFSGALLVGGDLSPVDGDALKRKIDRAFFSRLRYLVVPRENMTRAWECLSELESRCPGRKLELVGADTLDTVAGDPRVVPGSRLSPLGYTARRMWNAKRAPAVEVTALVAALYFLLYLVIPPRYMPWFDRNPAYAGFNEAENSLEARNRDSLLIWSEPFQCKLSAAGWSELIVVRDLDGDGMNEVLFMPLTTEASSQRDWLYCFSADHQLRFKRYCAIRGQYPGDTAGVSYDPEHLNIVSVAGKSVIITEVAGNSPGRSHIRLWDACGDSLGWYINAGASRFVKTQDLDADGREELLFLNFNNRMNCTALLVLDLDSNVVGVSPPYQDSVYDLSRVRPGSQAQYALFPVTDLGKLDLANAYNAPGTEGVRENTKGIINVYVGESAHADDVRAIYSLDFSLRVVGVTFSDQFRKRRNDLVREGRLTSVDWSQYADDVRDSVLHWCSGSWVGELQLRVQSHP